MDQEKYIEDLKDIKDIMNRSSRFISLSGLSGVSAGVCALVGAYFAYQTVYHNQNYFEYSSAIVTLSSVKNLLVIGSLTFISALGSGLFFTYYKAKKSKQKLWDFQSKRLVLNLLLPLGTGAALCLILLYHNNINILAPLSLIFYGLALINASKYTLGEIRSLGVVQIILGLFGAAFIGYGMLLWAIGFGVLHIIYGIAMHLKYKS